MTSAASRTVSTSRPSERRALASPPIRGRAARSERGAVLPLVAMGMVAMLVMAAFVIDLGIGRTRSRSIQSAADFAALAAGPTLGQDQPRNACQAAVNNLRSNVTELKSLSASTFCGTMPVASCSSPASVTSPTTTAGGVTLRISYPATDASIAVTGLTGPWPNDGSACRRMTVSLTSRQNTIFGRIAGASQTQSSRDATVLGRPVTTADVPALWLLDPTGCTPLSVSGGSKITAGVDGTTPTPGLIAIDSDGSTCSSNQTTISSSGAGSELKAVPASGSSAGQVTLFALTPGATTCTAPACNQSDVTNGRLGPQPTSQSARATRAPVDWRFNCKSTYPNYRGIAINGCTSGAPAYIDNLVTAIGTSGTPSGFQKWTTGGRKCNVATGTTTVTGNWYVDCPSGFSVGNGTTVTFSGGNVVFDGDVSVSNGGALNINTANTTATMSSGCLPPTVQTPCTTSSSAKAAFVYQRSGNWSMTGGNLTVNRAAVIQKNGYLKVNSAIPTWLAPTEGPFKGLAYWSEFSSSQFGLSGGTGVQLNGVFFTPNAAPFSLSGGGTWGQQSAQFISYQLTVTGGGTATLVPDQTLIGKVTEKPGLLIR